MFLSHIIFGLPIWCNANQTYLKRIKILMKKAVRAIYCKPYNEHTAPLFKQGKLMTFETLKDYHMALFARSIRINSPQNIKCLLKDKLITHQQSTRQSSKFDQVDTPNFHARNLDLNCLKPIPTIWNNLPCELKQLPNSTFKKHMKKHFLAIQNDLL